MIAVPAIFTCSICGEPSTNICVSCTKDACRNHRCERCKRCSDCCECDVPLSAAEASIAPEEPLPAPVADALVPESLTPADLVPEALAPEEPAPMFESLTEPEPITENEPAPSDNPEFPAE